MSDTELQFRTSTFGGFQKQDVLNYIETSNQEHREKLEAVRRELAETEAAKAAQAEEIAAVMEVLSTGRSTGRESVQDAPLTEPYGSLTLENQGGETLLYYYEERGATLVEQPYTGIFRLEGSLEDLLAQLA